ncbi:MAG: AMP-binding protein, partial [Acidobacteria bacterium]|nr:AMP-binding protein [Acidobacteriota bacterium]
MPNAASLPLFVRIRQHGRRRAIVDKDGTHSYDALLRDASRVAASLLEDGRRMDLDEERVAFLITPSYCWVSVLWGIWLAGGIAVPLPLGAPAAELEYLLDDTQAEAIIFDEANETIVRSLAATRSLRAHGCANLLTHTETVLPAITPERRAMILYTSGTTSRPKGVVTTHANITAQVATLVAAWEWSADDRILLCLPLHHVHGIINIVSCAMWSGAICEMLPRFDAKTVWERIASGELTLFMAVPTIYLKLIAEWETSPRERQRILSKGAAKLRLMVSGSAALPVGTLKRWKEITGHTLLERYGMTEMGMALSNSYRGQRIPGSVGTPLPGVEVRLVDERG